MNKKVIAAGMAMVLASMGLTACGDSGSKEAKDSSDETYTVTMAYIGDKEEDTDRIEKKINEIMKKDINGTRYRTDQLGCLCGNNEADSIRWRKDGHCTNPGGTG